MSKRSFRICSISAFRDAVFLLVVQPSISPAEEQRTQLFLFLSCRPVSIFRTFVTSAAGVKVLISVSLWIRRVVPYRRKGKHCVPAISTQTFRSKDEVITRYALASLEYITFVHTGLQTWSVVQCMTHRFSGRVAFFGLLSAYN